MVEVEIRMAWCPVPLWFVPDEPAAEQLLTEGISSGRVWTIAEPLDLPAIPGLTKAHARTLALAKLEVDGLLTDVRPADPRDDVPRAPPTRSSRTRGTRAYVR
jgi:hypothetical protein